MQGAIGLGPWYVLVRLAVRAEVLLGLCAAIADCLGTATQPLVMADAVVNHQRTLSTAAARQLATTTKTISQTVGITPRWLRRSRVAPGEGDRGGGPTA